MQPIKSNRPSFRTIFAVLTVLVLAVGVFSAVNLSLQSQDTRSHASSKDNYSKYGSSYNSYSNQSSYNSYGGSSYSGSLPCISVIFITIGSCGSSSSQPTSVPCGYTMTSSKSDGKGGLINIFSNKSGGLINIFSGGGSYSNNPVPTQPCAAPTETPAPYYPTATPAPYYPTPTPQPYYPTPTSGPVYGGGATNGNMIVYLHGIGNGGDNVNPTSQGNATPLHPSRTLDVQIFNAANQLVTDNQGTISYNSSDGDFTGQVNLGDVATGPYTVKVKTDQYLRGQLAGIQTLTSGQPANLGPIKLIVGDINNDNQANILDYNILIGCYSDLTPAVSCTQANNLLADLNDDGHVNQYDYNLFIRELTNVNGQ